jgi:hypothetical protein
VSWGDTDEVKYDALLNLMLLFEIMTISLLASCPVLGKFVELQRDSFPQCPYHT